MQECSFISTVRTNNGSPANPYRRVLRKNFPEPVIALLAFVLGIWMWDHYLSPMVEYPVGTEELALLKIDRDLRLADAMEKDPAWLRRFVGLEDTAEVRKNALYALETLEVNQAMGPRSIEAYPVVRAEVEGVPVGQMIERLGGSSAGGPADPGSKRGSWWSAKMIEAGIRENPSADWRERYESSLRTLRVRSVGASAVLGALALAGACCLPATLRGLAGGLKRKQQGYSGAWTPALGLTVFIVGTLAWIGYVGALDLGIEAIVSLPPLMGLLLDTAARLLPTLIAIGFLFKRPGHAVRVLGVNRPPYFGMVLGTYALLLLAEVGLRLLLGNDDAEPGSGLSLADAGVSGLVFAVVSACLVAPLAEEVLYRGVLFRSLRNRLGVLAAAALSAIIFSAVHFYDLHGFLSVAMFGFAAALLYAGTGSLFSVVLLHVVHNVMIKIPAWIFYHMRLEW